MLPGMTCASCGTAAGPGAKFCAECGSPLASGCPGCGADVTPGAKFCPSCGTPLRAAATAAPLQRTDLPGDLGEPDRPAPVAERRLVSVLFADLVGFTGLSEARDAEEVRELLSHYFEVCRNVVERHGGVVEKFIGDAVMAVWGAPVANEDDAERAVRSALELVVAVAGAWARTSARPGFGCAPACSPARRRSPSAPPVRAWSQGTWSTRPAGSSRWRAPARCWSARRPAARPMPPSATSRRAFHELKGKAEPLALFRAAAGGGRSQRLDAGRGSRGAVRRSRPRAADAQGPVPLQRRPPHPAAGDRDRHRRGRQVPAVVGVREVHRRAGRQRVVAPGSLPVLRRRGDLLGAGRHDADAGRVGRGRGPGSGRGQAGRHGGPVRAGPGRAPLDRAPARPAARARRPADDRAGRPVRRLAAVRRADVGRWTRSCWSSRTCTGPTRRCWTSSTTCSSGPATTRSSCSR